MQGRGWVREELPGSPLLLDPSVLHDYESITVEHGLQAVRYGDHCAVHSAQCAQCALGRFT